MTARTDELLAKVERGMYQKAWVAERQIARQALRELREEIGRLEEKRAEHLASAREPFLRAELEEEPGRGWWFHNQHPEATAGQAAEETLHLCGIDTREASAAERRAEGGQA